MESLKFFMEVIDAHWGTYIFRGVFYFSLLYIYVTEREKWKKAVYVFFPVVILALMFFPLTEYAAQRIWGISAAYYCRLYSILPIFFSIGYALVLCVNNLKGYKRFLLMVCIGVAIAAGGRSFYINDENTIARNIEKLPADTIEICKRLHDDRRDVTIAVPTDISPYIRQYDSSFFMPYGRISEYNRLAELLDTEDMNADIAAEAMKSGGINGCDYIVVKKTDSNHEAFKEIGSMPQAYLENVLIYKIENCRRIARKYDKKRRVKEIYYYDKNGELGNTEGGYAIIKYELDRLNRISKQMYYNNENQPVVFPEGYTGIGMEYNGSGQVIREKYLDYMGNNILTDSGIAGAEYAYDDGKRISEEYIDIEGDPTENNDGICKKKFFYENDTCKTLFFDKEDKSKEYNGYAGYIDTYDANERIIERVNIDETGQPIDSNSGVCRIMYFYDVAEGTNKVEKYNMKGELVKEYYDNS